MRGGGKLGALGCVLVLGLAHWQFLHWFGRRVRWGGSEGYEWVAVASLAAVLCVRLRGLGEDGAGTGRAARGWRVAALSAWAFALTYPLLGDLGRGLVAATGLAATASARILGRGSLAPAVVLAWIGLPVVPMLQLHLGYPLRAAVGRCIVTINDVVGAVPGLRAEGAALVADGRWMLIDEPCSGVRLLWAALFSGSLVALMARLSALRGAALMLLAVGLAVVLQGVRTAGLVVVEWRAGGTSVVSDLHDVSGLAAAALLFGAICLVAHRAGGGRAVPAGAGRPSVVGRPGVVSATLGLLAAAVVPIVIAERGGSGPSTLMVPSSGVTFPGWPAEFEGDALAPAPLREEDHRFIERFRGELARFTRAGDEVILAWTAEPTAEMHSTAICLRGAGYRVRPEGAHQDATGALWARFTAERAATRISGRERIRDAAGHSWSDLSAWWWAALLGRTRGPWWKELIITREAKQAALPAPQ